MPSEHSDTVGGSSAARVIACPGSVAQCRMAPPQTSSIYAKTGTMLHDIMEDYLLDCTNNGPAHPRHIIGRTIDSVQFTKSLYDKKVKPSIDWFENTLNPDEWITEAKCAFPGIPGAFGTADIIYRKGDEYGVVDWKFGDGVPVKIESNAQIMFYLLAAVNTHRDFFPEKITALRGHIFQPFTNPEKEPHSVATFTWEELQEFKALLTDAVGTARSNDAPLNIGDHCKWCAAKAFCPQLRDAAAGMLTRNGERTPEEMLSDLAMADSLEQLVKEIRKSAADYVRRGNRLPGWKLVETLGNRAWKGDVEADLRKLGLRVMDLYPRKMDTPAGVQRAIKARGLQKKIDIDPFVTRPITGDKIVLEESKTPEKKNVVAALKKLSTRIRATNLRA